MVKAIFTESGRPDGVKYVGDWIHSKRNGKGTMTYHNDLEYVGDSSMERVLYRP